MPQARISLPYNRSQGSVALVAYGTGAAAVRTQPNQDGGYLTSPILLPPAADLTRPIDVYSVLRTQTTGGPINRTVHHRLRTSGVEIAVGAGDSDIVDNWIVPANWAVDDIQRYLWDSGNGHTFNGGTLVPNMYLGFRYERLGTNGADNYDQATEALAMLEFVYFIRCQAVCCCG